jgi:1-acyl-sn-glycerol-3-phosphate acyltransferase
MKHGTTLSIRLLMHTLLLRPFLWLVFGVNIRGRENLEGLDQFILIANHNSHLDTLLLYAAMPVRQTLKTHPVAAKDYFSKPRLLFELVSFLFRPVWVDREESRGDTIRNVQQLLDQGESIILFPEGTRGEAGVLQRFRGGIGRIVEANPSIPVVVAFLEGPERALPRSAPVPLPLWNHVTITPPQIFRGTSGDITQSLWQDVEHLHRQAREARQRRPASRRPVFTVAVLGVDGSGKSTLSTRLAQELSAAERTCLIGDHLQLFEGGSTQTMQPLSAEKIRHWVSARAKHAKSLVAYKIPKMTDLFLRDYLLTEAARWYRPEWIFVDGMPLLNLTAWAILYREEHFTKDVCSKALSALSSGGADVDRADPVFRQFPELLRLKQVGLDRMRMPDAVIFLDVPPAVCIARIDSRGEKKQVHETEEKLAKLRDAYLLVCSVLEDRQQTRVLVLEGNRELDRIIAEGRQFVTAAKEHSNVEGSC